jgi:NAD(P)-dependent dehydrogenase (short-subunit alcohol dehydrogenase family)
MAEAYVVKNHSFKGKLALVTGGSRGIGAGIAKELASRGCSVILNYNAASSESKANDLAKELEALDESVKVHVVQANLGDMDGIKKLSDAVIKHAGDQGLDFLINNAGVSENFTLETTTLETYTKQYDINVRAPLFLTQQLLPHLNKGGRIVNLSSVSARMGFPKQTVYGGTKAALEAMTRTWAREFAQKHEITVNAVAPGPVSSEMWHNSGLTADTSSLPSGDRIGEPDDIARVVGFLCEDGSRWINGNVLSTNGGMMLL